MIDFSQRLIIFQELDIILNVKYDGNWQVEIDANLVRRKMVLCA